MPPSINFEFGRPTTPDDPLAYRRRTLAALAAQRNQQIAFGRQEEAQMRAMLAAEQDEWKIRNEIVKHREVAAATEKLSRLDPTTDPNWRVQYARVMAAYPYAQDDKFLNENFMQLGRLNQSAMDHAFATFEERDKDAHTKENLGIEAENRMQLARDEYDEHAAAMGVNREQFFDPDTGQMNWAKYSTAMTAAKKAAAEDKVDIKGRSIPSNTIDMYSKYKADIAQFKDVNPDDDPDNYRIFLGADEGRKILENAYPQLRDDFKPPVDPNAKPAPAGDGTAKKGDMHGRPFAKAPPDAVFNRSTGEWVPAPPAAATPAATPAPVAAPTPAGPSETKPHLVSWLKSIQ